MATALREGASVAEVERLSTTARDEDSVRVSDDDLSVDAEGDGVAQSDCESDCGGVGEGLREKVDV